MIALMATRSLGIAVLDSILKERINVVVIAEPDDHKLAKACIDKGVWLTRWRKETKHATAAFLQQVEAKAVLAAHWFQYVPREIREATPQGVLAYHPSLLPRHRGKDSVRDTIAAGDAFAGGTVYQMDEGLDTGPIVKQAAVVIEKEWDASRLWREHLFPIGVELLTLTAVDVDRGHELTFVKQ